MLLGSYNNVVSRELVCVLVVLVNGHRSECCDRCWLSFREKKIRGGRRNQIAIYSPVDLIEPARAKARPRMIATYRRKVATQPKLHHSSNLLRGEALFCSSLQYSGVDEYGEYLCLARETMVRLPGTVTTLR